MSQPIPPGLIYLSLPYSHPDKDVIDERMQCFWEAVAGLICVGVKVISPMSLMPAMVHLPDHAADWASWEQYCKTLLNVCDEVWVLCLPGWDCSIGVGGEIQYAKKLGKPVKYIDGEGQTLGDTPPN